MAWSASIRVYGQAATQGSKRHVGKGVMVESCKRLKSWRAQVQEAMLAKAPAAPLDVPVLVDLRVYVGRPATHYRTKKGQRAGIKPNVPERPAAGLDLDKVARAIGDAGQGVWWANDSRIVSWGLDRLYSEDGREYVEIDATAPDAPEEAR